MVIKPARSEISEPSSGEQTTGPGVLDGMIAVGELVGVDGTELAVTVAVNVSLGIGVSVRKGVLVDVGDCPPQAPRNSTVNANSSTSEQPRLRFTGSHMINQVLT